MYSNGVARIAICKLWRKKCLLALVALTVYFLRRIFYMYIEGDIDYLFLTQPMDKFQYPLEVDVHAILRHERNGLETFVQPINEFPLKSIRYPHHKNITDLVVMVKSHVCHFEHRDIIRRTWGSYESNKAGVYFHVGMTNNVSCNNELEQESSKYRDVLQSRFYDFYFNNTIKMILSLRYVTEKCAGAKFALFVDDDYYISIPNALSYIKTLPKGGKLVWAGFKCSMCYPNRGHWIYNKPYSVPIDEYKFSYWPPFIHAGAVLLSINLTFDFYVVSKYTKLLRFDDVYLGIIARKLNISGHHLPKLFPYPVGDSNKFPIEDSRLRDVIASHRIGNATEVELIWNYWK